MIVQLNVEELRGLITEVIRSEMRTKSANGSAPGLLNAEQAAQFLGYSMDWVYKNWAQIGGRKIGKRGLRFDSADLQRWVDSRRSA